MIYFLDTNICIYHLNDSAPNLSRMLEQTPLKDIKIPSMVAAELLYGAEKSAKRERNKRIFEAFLSIYDIINFDVKVAAHYAVIRAELERNGKIIGGNDMIIAATALANNGVLVTNNTDEFTRIKGLIIEDWTNAT
jgi:tRNA(fMet)-specific endonuclease VapC